VERDAGCPYQFSTMMSPPFLMMWAALATTRMVMVPTCRANMAVATAAESEIPMKARNANTKSTKTQAGNRGSPVQMVWQ
jgi:hypothetical protein